MRCTVTKRNSYFLGIIGVFVSVVLAAYAHTTVYAGNTVVAATVCQGQSSINLTQPASDSTVAESTVPIAGTVNQANQIEVYVDDAFDSIIPLTVGQTNFTGSVELSQGTHTIKVVAINICPGPNGSASNVVTYTPPPNTSPSEGTKTPTTVNSESGGGGVTVSTAGGEISNSGTGGPPFPEQLAIPFQQFLGWLNINTGDSTEAHGLSLWRAVVVGGGLYLMIVGVATTAVQLVANVPVIAAALPAPTASGRVKWLSWGFRGLGLLLLLAGLFL